jgi:DNA-binding NarL/FixJ family response regulator
VPVGAGQSQQHVREGNGGIGLINILLADDHSIVRAGLLRIIEETPDIKMCAEAADGREAIQKVHETQPDVAVLDISMPGLDGLEVIHQLALYYPKLPILILTVLEEEQYIWRALKAGAKGYVTKRSAPEQLVNAIRKVYQGGRYLTDEVAEALASRLETGESSRTELDGLSNREIQVLRRLALGQTNREIAEAYHISIKTVDTYRLRLLKKLNLRNNADLSRFAIQHGLVTV